MSAPLVKTFHARDWAWFDDSDIARPLSLPATWSRCRIGCLMALSGAASVTPIWGMGLSSGTTNLLGDATTDNWIGLYSSGAWTYGTGKYTSSTITYAKRVGSTTTAAGGASGYDIADVGTFDHVSGYFADIIRTSVGNFTITILGNDTVPTGANSFSLATFADLMGKNSSLVAVAPSGYFFHSSSNITLDESTFPLNAVNIHWSGSTTKLVIDRVDVAVWD